MKKLIAIVFTIITQFGISQSFTVQDEYMTLSGNSNDGDFSKNTYLDALNNETLTWSIVLDSVPQGWQYSNCFPNCYPIGATSGTLNITQGDSYYLNAHFYPNNVAGEGKIVMEINDNNGTVKQVTWYGIAGSVDIVNSYINNNKKEIEYIYNLSGQIVREFTPNQFYIIVYNDGSKGKIFVTEQ